MRTVWQVGNSLQMRTQRTPKVRHISGVEDQVWALIVDTEFLYMGIKRRFGRNARVDYLRLPENVVNGLAQIQYFIDKRAIVMRHSNVWEGFAASLERFGYTVIPTDRGLHPRAVSKQAEKFLEDGVDLVMVSSLDRVMDFASSFGHLQVKVFTFTEEGREILGPNGGHVEVLDIDQNWLWRRGS